MGADTPQGDATLNVLKNPMGSFGSIQSLIPILMSMTPQERQRTLAGFDLPTQVSILFQAGQQKIKQGDRFLTPQEVMKMLWVPNQVVKNVA